MPHARKAPGAPAGRDPEQTRARILQAALAQFSAKGFAGARVDVIARQAGVNKRMLYHYFGHKADLFRAVLRRKLAERQCVRAVGKGGGRIFVDLDKNPVHTNGGRSSRKL